MKLGENFYRQEAVSAAKNLLGKRLIRKTSTGKIETKIVETEAYMGAEDKASHAYQNKKTERTRVMFKKGGFTYVYLIYGMYYCLNIVTGPPESPQAVLIRAVEPISGLKLIQENRKINPDQKVNLTNGPGKLCEALVIDKSLNNLNLIKNDKLFITDKNNKENIEIKKAPRINIDYAEEYKDKLWRFYIKNNPYVKNQ